MAPFQFFFLLLSLAVFPLCWLRGGHTERAGVAILLSSYLLTYVVHGITLRGFLIGDATIDLGVLAGFAWLAVRRDRWWTLLATAFAGLTMIAHILMFATPDLQEAHIRADVASRWGLGVMLVLCLAAGVGERWMAGERPVSDGARWRRAPKTVT
ncbi:MAG TPA: hypothetical protein VGB60_11290 [Brevundimonas sp.]|jgi:hypothetical protein|uniref:hypothetical protein n=1 Tax=Brevundimonas sp. TaxID=1871086 RepID=UPI002EDA9BF5